MLYQQKVILKGIDIPIVIKSFHNRRFVDFLISMQPVKIKSWDGIENGKEAIFSFWFFGWKNIRVVHNNYKVTNKSLHFEDSGLRLPFGLEKWNHHHTVQEYKDGVIIIDKVYMKSNSLFFRPLIYLIMLFPVVIRKVTYKIWFKRLNYI
ncbi:MAG: hypothetical protein ACJZ12_00175 [Candidatus Neomarinimicrobiota bacterium]